MNTPELPIEYQLKLQFLKNEIWKIEDIDALRAFTCQIIENNISSEYLFKELMKVDAQQMRKGTL